MAESNVSVTTEDVRKALQEKGFVQVEEKKAFINGRTIYGFIAKQSIGSYGQTECVQFAQDFYKKVNEWSVHEGYGRIAFASCLPTLRKYNEVFENCDLEAITWDDDDLKNKNKFVWIASGGYDLLYNEPVFRCVLRNQSKNGELGGKDCLCNVPGKCFPIVWTY